MLEIAERAAREAGRIMREGRACAVQHKGAVNLVTEIDLACETAVREILAQGDPGIPVLGEEEGGAEGASTRWIVDPLDGTTNYVHGYPSYCCCIALQDRGELEIGVIYDPVRDQCYRGQRSRGADLDGAPLRVSTCDDLDRGLMASGFPYDRRERIDEYLAYVRAFVLRAQGFRRAGAAGMDLALLAAGRVDGFWEFGLQPWDVAAGALLIREAGGEVTDMDGGPLDVQRPRILASNGLLHQAMLEVIAELL